jgi:hypothetical protein
MPSVFDRLYQTETASSAGKRVEQQEAPSSPPTRSNECHAPGLPGAGGGHKTEANHNHSPVFKSSDVSACTEGVFATKLRLLCSDEHHPDSGFSELSPSSLHLVPDLYRFEKGDIDQRELAKSIMEALWSRDFMPGAHWDIESASVEYAIEGVWDVSKSATWDWKDIYSVAKSMATIRFPIDAGEIRIENYSYYVAG